MKTMMTKNGSFAVIFTLAILLAGCTLDGTIDEVAEKAGAY